MAKLETRLTLAARFDAIRYSLARNSPAEAATRTAIAYSDQRSSSPASHRTGASSVKQPSVTRNCVQPALRPGTRDIDAVFRMQHSVIELRTLVYADRSTRGSRPWPQSLTPTQRQNVPAARFDGVRRGATTLTIRTCFALGRHLRIPGASEGRSGWLAGAMIFSPWQSRSLREPTRARHRTDEKRGVRQ